MKAIVIDDEYNGRFVLQQKLKTYCPAIEVVAEAENGLQGIEVIGKFHPELVFLDIEMPEMDGFEMLLRLPQKNFHLVFTTAYDHYAIKAIRYAAFDYLLKPIDIEELKSTVDRLGKLPVTPVMNEKLETLEHNLLSKPFLNKIAIPTLEGILFYDVQDIVRLEAESNYTNIYFSQHPKLMASRTLKEFEEILPPEIFFRPHNSFIINMNYIKRYIRGDGGQIEMKDGSYILVSRRRKEEFLKLIGK
jgi:two-component system LytT family response regulator